MASADRDVIGRRIGGQQVGGGAGPGVQVERPPAPGQQEHGLARDGWGIHSAGGVMNVTIVVSSSGIVGAHSA